MNYAELLVHVEALSLEDRHHLLEHLMTTIHQNPITEKTHDILEFAGAGAYAYDGEDAQDYINRLRDEWERPSSTL